MLLLIFVVHNNKPTEMDTELEHVIPRSKGGSHCLANIVPACRSCNRSKYNYEMELWYKKQIFYKKERLDKIKNLLKQTPYPVKQQSLFQSGGYLHNIINYGSLYSTST